MEYFSKKLYILPSVAQEQQKRQNGGQMAKSYKTNKQTGASNET